MTDTFSAIGPDVSGPDWLKQKAPSEGAAPPHHPPMPPRPREDAKKMGFGSGFPGPSDNASEQARETPRAPSRSIDLTSSIDDSGAPAPLWSTNLGHTGRSVRPPNPLDRPAPAARPSRPPPPKRTAPPKASGTQPLELIWMDESRAEDIAHHRVWAALLPEVPVAPPDWKERAEFGYGPDVYDELHPPSAPDGRPAPERDALLIMQKARVQPLSSLATSVSEALRNDEPLPLVNVAGRLAFSFDPRKHLETLLSAAKPFGKGHPRLGEAIQHAEEMLEAPIEAIPEVARRVVDQLRAAWKDASVEMPATYLDQTAERVLLTARAYDRRQLLASSWLRSALAEASSHSERVEVTTYLPAEVDKRLPLFPHFDARLIADALPRQDGQETPTVCLRVVAIARVISDPRNLPPARS